MYRSLIRRDLTFTVLVASVLAFACSNDGEGSTGAAGVAAGGFAAGGGDGGGGRGGSAGHGGTGGSAGKAIGAGGFDHWFEDPSLWLAVPQADEVLDPACRAFQGDPTKIRRTILDWESCGDGCEVAVLDFGLGPDAAGRPTAGTAAGPNGGEGFLSMEVGYVEGEMESADLLVHIVGLKDGRLAGSLRLEMSDLEKPCGPGIHPDTPFAPLINGRTREGSGSKHLDGVFNPSTDQWTWYPPWRKELLCDPFPLFGEDGDRLLSSCGSVGGFLTPGSGSIGLIASGVNAIDGSGAARDGVAVWAELVAPGTTRIRAWEPDGAVRTLVPELPGVTCRLSVGDERVVGLHLPSNGACYVAGPGVRLWHAPTAGLSSELDLTMGPALVEFDLVVSSFNAWNDHAALWVMDRPTGKEYGLVVRLSDWTIRRIVPQERRSVYYNSLTVDDRYVYWVEGLLPKVYKRGSEVYRYELDKLDQLGTPYDGVAP